MIFVTVGTGKFDELIKKIDMTAANINEKIISQIGKGDYIPKNAEYFRFKPSLMPYYRKARLIISHGGAGTTYELLEMGKKIISLANPNRTDVHQEEILKALSKDNYLIWCKNPGELEETIRKAKAFQFRKYTPPECKIAEKIREFLKKCAA
ncbi:MAG: PssE/Cps14G family polysaccharide biosynthesis glycosyltransferase [archaeon]